MAGLDGEAADGKPVRRAVVLVVEDEPLIRDVLAQALRDAGCEVVEAAGAEEALRALEAQVRPDVLVTDVKMPGPVNGFELAVRMRAVRPGLRVIVTSGDASAEGARGVADEFLPKPYGLGEMVHRVQSLAAA